VVSPGGSIVLLTDAEPALGPAAALLRRKDDASQALKLLEKESPDDLEAGFLWASAAQRAKLYLLSRLPIEVAEELFTTPLENVGQAQRLLKGTTVVLPDAHQTMAVVTERQETAEPL
jgi:hypothetical protein